MNILVKNVSDDKKAQLTFELLHTISNHLSSRKDCRGKTYRVAIGVRDEEQSVCRSWPRNWSTENCIFFDTDVMVYPNIHEKQCTDKRPVIAHVIIEHFSDIWQGACNGCQCQINPNALVHGIYEYRTSLNNKSRRWFRIS